MLYFTNDDLHFFDEVSSDEMGILSVDLNNI